MMKRTEPSGDPEAMSCGSCGGDNESIRRCSNGRRAKSGSALSKAGMLRVVELLEVPE